MSLKTRKRIKTPTGLFSRALKRGSELGPVDLFFMSSETRKRIKTLTGLFFTSMEMRERKKPALHSVLEQEKTPLMRPVFCTLQETGHLISVEF